MRKLPLQQAIPAICSELNISPVELARRVEMSDVGVRNWAAGRSREVKKLRTRHRLAQVARQAGITIEGLE